MIPSLCRKSRVVVDLEAIRFNVKNEKKRLSSPVELFAVVKADGYGHGAVEVSKTALLAGASGLCVSNLDEALQLRKAGIEDPVIVLSYVSLEFLKLATEYNITLTATNLEWIEELDGMVQEPIKIHLKIDTGMGRVGLIDLEDIQKAATLLRNNSLIDFEGVFTHFAKADSTDETYFELQKSRFIKALDMIDPTSVKYIHTSNSATALWHDAFKSSLVRFGVAMYGLNPSGNELRSPYPLKQALSLETEITHVKCLEKGEQVGYGATYETKSKEWIGTLPIGYADGIRRDLAGFEVLVMGKKQRIVGRVCMDQLMIRLDQKYPVGTKVTIFGLNEGLFNSVQSGADYLKTINYEVTCGLSDRLPRVYIN